MFAAVKTGLRPILCPPLGTLALVALGGMISLAPLSGARAATTISTFSNSPQATDSRLDAVFGEGTPAPTVTGSVVAPPIRAFTLDGVTMTFSDPENSFGNVVSRSNNTLGTCIGGNRPGTMAVCGNPPAEPAGGQLNSIQLTFDKTVRLLSTAGVLRSQGVPTAISGNVTSAWTTTGSTESFLYALVAGDPQIQNYSSTFSDFIAVAGDPVYITSDFNGELDYWMQSIEFEALSSDVPGPLPVLGAVTAFAWSRRVRRRINAVKVVKSI